MTDIFIEFGTTLHSTAHSGIQRVVRNIIAQTKKPVGPAHFQYQPVYYVGPTILRYHPPQIITRQQRLRQSAKMQAERILRRIKVMIGYVVPRSWLRAAVARIRRLYYTATIPHHPENDILLLVEQRAAAQASGAAAGEPPVLLLLDSSWYMDLWPLADRFRAAGGHVCAVLYDLIPFTHPDTVHDITRAAHTDWWRLAPEHVDSVMCISQTVRDEFLAWQETLSVSRRLPPEKVGYFHLGSELPALRGLQKSPHTLPKDPYFLAVGTLEPRKNHAVILDAFDMLWQAGMDVRLIIVGAFGWKSEALLERIRSHAELGQRLFHHPKACDRELNALYGGAAAVIAASIAEGFGLPVVEAYQRGTRVICSDIPVFREVAGEQATYFDPYQPATLAEAVRSLLQKSAPSRPAGACWITWKDSADQLFYRLEAMLHAAPEPAAPTSTSAALEPTG